MTIIKDIKMILIINRGFFFKCESNEIIREIINLFPAVTKLIYCNILPGCVIFKTCLGIFIPIKMGEVYAKRDGKCEKSKRGMVEKKRAIQ
jgi:hypothetical protein